MKNALCKTPSHERRQRPFATHAIHRKIMEYYFTTGKQHCGGRHGDAGGGGGCYRTAPLREKSRSVHTQADSLAIDARLAVFHRRRQARLCDQKQATGAVGEGGGKRRTKKSQKKQLNISRYPPYHTVPLRTGSRLRHLESQNSSNIADNHKNMPFRRTHKRGPLLCSNYRIRPGPVCRMHALRDRSKYHVTRGLQREVSRGKTRKKKKTISQLLWYLFFLFSKCLLPLGNFSFFC